MNSEKGLSIMLSILNKKPGSGKTAVMKYIYILQSVYKLALGYDFEIYTYGPYSADVMADIDYAKHEGLISMMKVEYPNGIFGYSIEASEKAKEYIHSNSEYLKTNQKVIDGMLGVFGDKSAKDLELYSTIIYQYAMAIKNNWNNDVDSISIDVHEIKPHFSISVIKNAYSELYSDKVLPLVG